MCVSFDNAAIAAIGKVNHTSYVAVVTPTDRSQSGPQSLRYGRLLWWYCVVTLLFDFFLLVLSLD